MTQRPWSSERIALWLVHLAALAAFLYFAWSGLDYYLRPLTERARHPLYWLLKPGGTLGLRFGYVGAAMMTLLLLYSVRKRVVFLRGLGSLRKWLDWHIFLGIYGPLFVVLHSSLKARGLVSIAFWSMVAVAASGVLGRFLYRQIPRSARGDELPRASVVAEDQRLTAVLSSRWGLTPEQLAEVLHIAEKGATGRVAPLMLLLRLPFDVVSLRLRLGESAPLWRGLDRKDRREAAAAARDLARVHRRLLLFDQLRRLFRYWHVFHKPFAVILYTLMIVHIAVAWLTGYGSFRA